MSQYPWIYQPPNPPPRGYDPAAGLLSPARRAGILAIILGALMLLCGVGLILFSVGFEKLPAEVRSQLESDVKRYGAAGVNLKAVYMTAAIVIFGIASAMIVMGIFVLRGGIGPVIALMVVTALLLIFLALQLFAITVGSQGDPRRLAGACVIILPLAFLGLLMWFLAGAVRAAPQVWLARMQHQSQFWQQQQNEQQYRQGGWFPPPPAPPPSAPPDTGDRRDTSGQT